MITLRRWSLFERLRRCLSPRYRRERDAQMRLLMRYLVAHPEQPVKIGDFLIPDGYGGPATFLCPVCGATLLHPPRDWSICPHCWCEFAGEGDYDAMSALPLAEYRARWRKGELVRREPEKKP